MFWCAFLSLPPHSSSSGRAFEAGKSSTALPEIERENSIFVSALKEHFQKGTLDESIDVLLMQAANGWFSSPPLI